MVLIVAKPPSLLTGLGVMSATMVTPGMAFEAVAHGGEARRQELDLVLRQEHDVGLAAELVVDVGDRRVGQRLAGRVLRRVEERGRRRRHDGADIAAGPHDLLEAVAQRRRIDRRRDDGADLRGEEELDLLDHLGRVVVGERAAVFEPAILGGHGQPVVDALHELALIVLRERQHLAQARRRAAGRRVRIERRKYGRRR